MSSVVLNESKIWVTGGIFDDGERLNSTEIISLDQPSVLGPKLPFTVSDHCLVLVNSSTIFLIGGIQNSQASNKTWIIDPSKDFQIKEGPSLNCIQKNGLGTSGTAFCAKMRIEGRIFLVAVGDGWNVGCVELLDTTCLDEGWNKGVNKFLEQKRLTGPWVPGTGYQMKGPKCWVPSTGYRTLGYQTLGYQVWGTKVPGPE